MVLQTRIALFFILLCANAVFGHDGSYRLRDIYVGEDFLEQFFFSDFNDPTHGRVNYLSKDEALSKGLVSYTDSKFFMQADHTNVVPPDARGRDSIRIQSNASHEEAVIILDLNHMPAGCATWPAFWTISSTGPWPQGGEIDIIEGVNLNTRNLASLHTTPDCTMPEDRFMLGRTTSTNCDTNVNFNQGCGVNFTAATYGYPFNEHDGGWYVLHRSDWGIRIYFWSRYDFTVPSEVSNPRGRIRPSFEWGFPEAVFPFTEDCSPDHFNAHQIIFDLTFCGDFAGALYPTSGCPGVCEDFVNNNPEKFTEAYWEINSLLVYTPDADY